MAVGRVSCLVRQSLTYSASYNEVRLKIRSQLQSRPTEPVNTNLSFETSIDLQTEHVTVKHERLQADEYIAFLARSDLGQQYPRERFRDRIAQVVGNVQISLVARNTENEVIAICFGLTDFAYWLFLTDLGVDRRYTRKGIGRRLVEATHELAGGERSIVMFTNVNEDAIDFYEKVGMKASSDIFAKWNIEWTSFEVGKDPLP